MEVMLMDIINHNSKKDKTLRKLLKYVRITVKLMLKYNAILKTINELDSADAVKLFKLNAKEKNILDKLQKVNIILDELIDEYDTTF